MAITDSEIERLRFFLGWGNLDVAAYPYTPDGFFEAFYDIVAPNLTTGAESTVAVSIAAAGIVTVTPAAMTDIVPWTRLVVDVGSDEETVTVRATTATTFTARFEKAHAASFPIAVDSGTTRLRSLLAKAEATLAEKTGTKISSAAGLKMVGQGEVEWFGVTSALMATDAQLLSIRRELSSLVRVSLREDYEGGRGPAQQTEVY
jgi:hypothetical protein